MTRLRFVSMAIDLRLITLFILVRGGLSAAPPEVREPLGDDTCSSSNPDTYRALEQCAETGEKFIRKYLKNTRRGKKTNQCGIFADFEACLDPIFDRCPNLRHAHQGHWIKVYDIMKCSCNGTSECMEQVTCFSKEYQSLLMSRCDDHYRFNRQQRTRHKCHHLRENIRCKEALVTSACGNATGEFAFHMFKLYNAQSLANERCRHIDRHSHYSGFRYSEACPANFPQEMETCAVNMTSDARLAFYPGNDLIAEKKKHIRDACRRYDGYERCVAPLKERCPRGSEIVYGYLGQLRTYLLKMNFICNLEKDSYSSNLNCYKRVLNNRTLTACDNIWRDLQPKLNSLAAYQFYCELEDPKTLDVRSSLDRLVSCYQAVFTAKCGDGGSTIGALMTTAFMDPFYLQYGYRPDCEYHRPPPTTSPPYTEITTARSRKPGSFTTKKHDVYNDNNPPPQPRESSSQTDSTRREELVNSAALSLPASCITIVTLAAVLHFVS